LQTALNGFQEALGVPRPWYPGWSSRLDGAAQPVEQVDGALVGVALPPGPHTVELRYRPAGLEPGLALSLAATLGLVALAWKPRRPTPRSARAARGRLTLAQQPTTTFMPAGLWAGKRRTADLDDPLRPAERAVALDNVTPLSDNATPVGDRGTVRRPPSLPAPCQAAWASFSPVVRSASAKGLPIVAVAHWSSTVVD
jgi:hypothetical protein